MKIWIVKMILKFDDGWEIDFICEESKYEYELKDDIFEPIGKYWMLRKVYNNIDVYSAEYNNVYVATKGFADKPSQEELLKLKEEMKGKLIDFIDNEYELYSINYNNKINCLKEI